MLGNHAQSLASSLGCRPQCKLLGLCISKETQEVSIWTNPTCIQNLNVAGITCSNGMCADNTQTPDISHLRCSPQTGTWHFAVCRACVTSGFLGWPPLLPHWNYKVVACNISNTWLQAASSEPCTPSAPLLLTSLTTLTPTTPWNASSRMMCTCASYKQASIFRQNTAVCCAQFKAEPLPLAANRAAWPRRCESSTTGHIVRNAFAAPACPPADMLPAACRLAAWLPTNLRTHPHQAQQPRASCCCA